MKKYPLSLLASEGLGELSNYSESFLLASMGGAEAFSPFFSFLTLRKLGLGGKGRRISCRYLRVLGFLSRPVLP